MVPNFLSVAWHEEGFHLLGVHYVESLILSGALFPLDGGRRERKKKGKKKKYCRVGGVFPKARPSC
jgi:hypothetical protein